MESENHNMPDFINVIEGWRVPYRRTTDEAKSLVMKRILVNNFVKIGAIAASVGLIMMVGIFLQIEDEAKSIGTGLATTKVEVLPDGSKVILNSASLLEYNLDTWNFKRELYLKGEAFFDVVPGSKFTVNTDKGSVEVLGTSFNVKQRLSGFDVYCRTGKVHVKSAGQEVLLKKGDGVKLDVKDKLRSYHNNSGYTSLGWLKGEFYFTNEPLRHVFYELECQYNVKVDCPAEALERNYTGGFKNNSLKLALGKICTPMGLEYQIAGQKIIISSIE